MMDLDFSYVVQVGVWSQVYLANLLAFMFLLSMMVGFIFRDMSLAFIAIVFLAVLILLPLTLFSPVVEEERQKYYSVVMQDVAKEYGLDINGVDKIACVSGTWHYSLGDTWSKFEPVAPCADDRGLDVRFNEKWPY